MESILQWHLPQARQAFSVPFKLRVAAFTIFGISFLILGELRRHKLKKSATRSKDHDP